MSGSKVYLAKSNRADPDHTMKVRALLSEFDVEVVEFKGGAYTNQDLLACDMLIIIPELSNSDEDLQYVNLGKGLHNQIEDWITEDHFCTNLLIINGVLGDKFMVGQFDELDIVESTDYVNYSAALFEFDVISGIDERLTLRSILENKLDCKKTSSYNITRRSNRMLLLIK